MTDPLAAAAIVHQTLRDRLLEAMPDLAEDPDCLLDTLEGMTTLNDQLLELARSALLDEAMLEGLTQYRVKLAARAVRLADSSSRKRAIVLRYMDELGLKRLSAPDLTASRRAVAPSVVITDETALAEQFVRVKREPDKTAIRAALKAGEPVAGAELGNGGVALAIKI